jgi:hypothetical protein
MAAIPSLGSRRARTFITKAENAKKASATSPQLRAATSVKGEEQLVNHCHKAPYELPPNA